jgi:hypothetical protein
MRTVTPTSLAAAGWLYASTGEQLGFDPKNPVARLRFSHEDSLGTEPVGPLYVEQSTGQHPLVLAHGGYAKWFTLDHARKIAALLELPLTTL